MLGVSVVMPMCVRVTSIGYGPSVSASLWQKHTAPSEDRTHDLQIMRLTRCLLRYRGVHGRSSCYIIKNYIRIYIYVYIYPDLLQITDFFLKNTTYTDKGPFFDVLYLEFGWQRGAKLPNLTNLTQPNLALVAGHWNIYGHWKVLIFPIRP